MFSDYKTQARIESVKTYKDIENLLTEIPNLPETYTIQLIEAIQKIMDIYPAQPYPSILIGQLMERNNDARFRILRSTFNYFLAGYEGEEYNFIDPYLYFILFNRGNATPQLEKYQEAKWKQAIFEIVNEYDSAGNLIGYDNVDIEETLKKFNNVPLSFQEYVTCPKTELKGLIQKSCQGFLHEEYDILYTVLMVYHEILTYDPVKQGAFNMYYYNRFVGNTIIEPIEKFNEIYGEYFKDDTTSATNLVVDVIEFMKTHNVETFTRSESWFEGHCIDLAHLIYEQTGKNNINPKVLQLLISNLLTLTNLKEFPELLENVSKRVYEIITSGSLELSSPFEDGGYVEPEQEITKPIYEAYKKNTVNVHNAEKKVYNAWKRYEAQESKLDSHFDKIIQVVKKAIVGDVNAEIVEGKKFSLVKTIRNVFGSILLFSFSKIAFFLALVTRFTLRKQTKMSERKKIQLALQEELEIINEKIEDARGAGNQKAKYNMMRTRAQLQNALDRIKYGINVDEKSMDTAKSVIAKRR